MKPTTMMARTRTSRARTSRTSVAAFVAAGLAATATAMAAVTGCGSGDDTGEGTAGKATATDRGASPSIDAAARRRVEDALATTLPRIRQTISAVPRLEIPGMAVTVDLPGSGMVTVANGRADIEKGTPLTADTMFHIASQTKTFTAALIMRLDQERRLSIDDPISKYIAYPGGDAISVRQLLAHTSGIPDPDSVKQVQDAVETLTPAETVRLMGAHGRPLFAPGTSYYYSNANYLILGLIAEKVTGNAWHTEVRRRFFEPLHLDHTWVYGYEKAPTGTIATGYDPYCADKACKQIRMGKGSPAEWRFAWAAGAIVSTTRDLAVWIKALVGGDVLDQAHRTMMQTETPQARSFWAKQKQGSPLVWDGYGLGLIHYTLKSTGSGTATTTATATGSGWGHGGSIAGFKSESVYMAGRRFSFAMLTNTRSAFDNPKGNGSGELMNAALKAAAQ